MMNSEFNYQEAQTMTSASTTATTATGQIHAPSNVEYVATPVEGITFNVTPHEPTPR